MPIPVLKSRIRSTSPEGASVNDLTKSLSTLKMSSRVEITKKIAKTNIKVTAKPSATTTDPIIIDTPTAVADMVDSLENLPNNPPSLYLDLEGINLSRHGTISIMQIYHHPQKKVYLVDVHKLNKTAFETKGTKSNKTTLKTVLEDPTIQKTFFDVRNDSDALYAHFGVHLAGIQDIQLLELATRDFSRDYVNGLGKCIDRDAGLSFDERIESNAIKEKGKNLFAPERGGSYDVFNARPLSEDIVKYCAQDVQVLPKLWAVYENRKISDNMRERIGRVVQDRIDVCFEWDYTSKGRERAKAPLLLAGPGVSFYDTFL